MGIWGSKPVRYTPLFFSFFHFLERRTMRTIEDHPRRSGLLGQYNQRDRSRWSRFKLLLRQKGYPLYPPIVFSATLRRTGQSLVPPHVPIIKTPLTGQPGCGIMGTEAGGECNQPVTTGARNGKHGNADK